MKNQRLLEPRIQTKFWTPNKKESRGFPGGSEVKNLPANAEDTGLIPGPERSHIPRGN